MQSCRKLHLPTAARLVSDYPIMGMKTTKKEKEYKHIPVKGRMNKYTVLKYTLVFLEGCLPQS